MPLELPFYAEAGAYKTEIYYDNGKEKIIIDRNSDYEQGINLAMKLNMAYLLGKGDRNGFDLFPEEVPGNTEGSPGKGGGSGTRIPGFH